MPAKKSVPEGPVEIPEFLPVLPLRNSVLFPNSIIPIDVGRKKSVKLVEEAISKEKPIIGIVTQRDARVEDPNPADLYTVGCAARILKVIKLAKDSFSVILQGVSRVRLLELGMQDPYMMAKIQVLPDVPGSSPEIDALVVNVKDVAKRVIKLMPELPKEASALLDSVSEPGQLADLITSNLDVQVDEKQEILEIFDLKARLRRVLQFLSRQHEVLKVREKINTQVQEEMGRNQREYVLRQQLKAIKEELGEIDESGGDLDDFREKIITAKMPTDSEKVALKQLERLKVMQPSSAEYTVTRTYLEWLVELPWSISTEDKLDIPAARDILNATTTTWRRSRSAFSNTWRCASSRPTRRGRSCAWWVLPAWARPRSASPSRGRWGANSCACRWAGCATRRRFVGTGVPTSARFPDASSRA